MSYTVKGLSKISGVSVRTLHYYHQIGLLKPAQVGKNNYRYYQEDQLLLLQQILFFRELGFELKQIQTIITSSEFDKLEALQLHKVSLTKKINRTQKLIKTIDKTIQYLRGKTNLVEKSIYSGFDVAKQNQYDQYLVKRYGDVAKSLIAESKERVKGWVKADFDKVKKQHDALYKKFVGLMNKNLQPGSDEVQQLVQRHYDLVRIFYKPTRQVYGGLGKTYCEYPDFVEYFAGFHPNLAEFLAKAIRYFAKYKLESV